MSKETFPQPLAIEPGEEQAWQEHWWWIVDNPDIFSDVYVRYAWYCLHKTVKKHFRKPHDRSNQT